eukprot:CAMPEP_0202872680 /NCGR_PEP_ID=MMETSP1391-20130828/21767_1 /ASSEMBLY_ACC=CAM_ASM_000867 /TAXON_ID=1034604 /ORGANISM="Chlamydomonas leiostraca, Strain SAG 11-49" /LENGTH=46 /DNA_ID= /DNA_START= /DNA_END= /DNA_ORIENTATION=
MHLAGTVGVTGRTEVEEVKAEAAGGSKTLYGMRERTGHHPAEVVAG